MTVRITVIEDRNILRQIGGAEYAKDHSGKTYDVVEFSHDGWAIVSQTKFPPNAYRRHEATKTFRRGRLRLELDRDKVYPDDPGAGTPAMVHHDNGASATYWCATGEGILHGGPGAGDHPLTESQLDWLDGLDRKLTSFLYPPRG